MSTTADAQALSAAESFQKITDDISEIAERPKPPKAWYIAFAFALSLLAMFTISIGIVFTQGIGVWGNNNTEGWAWPIVNFVFWVGIAHAGTLISAILFLVSAKWFISLGPRRSPLQPPMLGPRSVRPLRAVRPAGRPIHGGHARV